VILAVFWAVMLASLWDKSLTIDEVGDVTAGYTYWKYNDYRLRPEHGNLPLRVMGLPLVLSGCHPPSSTSPAWGTGNPDALGRAWLYETPGNDVTALGHYGRAATSLFAVALGALTWLWSRRIFGRAGGLLSLLLYALNPTILANGALMTTDTAGAFFLFASLCALWALLHRISVVRLFASALVMAGLFATKQSAVLIVPIALLLVGARLISGNPLTVKIIRRRELARRGQQALALAAAAVFHALVVFAVIWALYGFRYDAINRAPSRNPTWNDSSLVANISPRVGQAVNFLEGHRLLPEAYIHGLAFFESMAEGPHSAFMNGEFGIFGWKSFFPYTFLVKTPLPVFAIIGLALAAMARSRRRPGQPISLAAGFYQTLPLWLLFILYWAAVLPSHFNLGHRYILATYPPLFVLCGVAGRWVSGFEGAGSVMNRDNSGSGSKIGMALCVLVALLAVEQACRFPNYLSYFNGLVQPARGYRHLVDSSLDWGQDLPGVKKYIQRHHLEGRIYLSYFGQGDLDYYKLPAIPLHSSQDVIWSNDNDTIELVPWSEQTAGDPEKDSSLWPDYDFIATIRHDEEQYRLLLKKPASLLPTAGTYFISATMLQPLTYDISKGPWGNWNRRYEERYQQLYRVIRPLLTDDVAARFAALKTRMPDEWVPDFYNFRIFSFARLTAYLRSREADDTVNFSILVYHLTAADIARAFDGPPPELGPDLPLALATRGARANGK